MESVVNKQQLDIAIISAATKQLSETIKKEYLPKGPLVNITFNEKSNDYLVTVLAYIPKETLNPVQIDKKKVVDSESIESNVLYLNYYGASTVKVADANGTAETKTCRDFRVEFNCDEGASDYNLYHIQFTYSIPEGTEPVDVIYVREQNDDPETDRGTVTGVAIGG